MAQHEAKTCPRCGAGFECRAGAVWQCQCAGVLLSGAQLAYIERHYTVCLCATCLRELRTEYNVREFNTRLDHLLRRGGRTGVQRGAHRR